MRNKSLKTFSLLNFAANTAKPRYLKLDRTGKKLCNIQVFGISKVIYLKYKQLGLTNHFNISIVFKISVFWVPKFDCTCNNTTQNFLDTVFNTNFV